jgi:hypothetical protein
MATPTAIEVSVDAEEYSRYETGRETITVTLSITGGAPYVDEQIFVDLIKARRSRDAVVATSTVSFTNTTDPQSAIVTFYLPDIVDQDLISLVRHGKYFVQATSVAFPTNATATIGTLVPNGQVSITADGSLAGSDGNAYNVAVQVPAGTAALDVSVVSNQLLVSLDVTGGSPSGGGANSATLIAAAIDALDDFSAAATGDGDDEIEAAEGPTWFTGGATENSVIATTDDFCLSIISVERLKTDFLFGLDLSATEIREPKFQPQSITGVTITELSKTHPLGAYELGYIYHEDDTTDATAVIGGGTDGTVTITADGSLAGSDGNAYTVTVQVPTDGPLSASVSANRLIINLATSGGVPDAGGANTATLVAAAIDALPDFSAVASGTGADSLSLAEGPTQFAGGTTAVVRQLNWNGGPLVSVTSSGTLILISGNGNGASGGDCAGGGGAAALGAGADYVCVRVASTILLPTENVTEGILITKKTMDDDSIKRYIQQAVAWVEKDFLATYVEPTNVVTDRDPTTIQYSAGINAPAPIFTDTDFDFIVSPLTYFVPRSQGKWVQIQTPFPQLLRVDSLYGAIANTRVIDIDLEWIEHSEQGGMIQLVPFNQEIAFDFIGLLWVNAIRGAAELPNFWHYNAIVGTRDATGDIQELIAKKAAIDALVMAGQAIRPGLGSVSLGRDGVSESVSYTNAAQYGMFTGTINSYKEWIEEHGKELRAKYRGVTMVVV